ncbi:valine--tRNA ligase [Argonema galeatum]|uniref:valine--tRNA ligase n=1 Tax=Argonema galeatum TaxID=2942762 RepID=UPI0020136E44|nr:valine--tRNA ligase [Argonema galeatum]MCL1462880.1 valine--tRNA ligase [Argonema galeatum A003/A1]
MTANLPPQYDPFTTEAKWQKFWEEKQIFKADPNAGGDPYSMAIPPPNVTGSLHMGHALGQTIMDIVVRYHRMKGRNTLWVPGTDHASIAVHVMLERELEKEGKTRDDLGREKFLDRAKQWKNNSGGAIVNQMRRLGISVDWSRERFTMDEGLSLAVAEAFVRLYDEGLIYRGNYLVNWCPATQSAVSDLEVEDREVNGNLWHFRYPLTDNSGYLEVATTRPETMLGDTGVAVNPNDNRYKDLIGKTVMLPIMNREIPIVADELVDPSFGTGCVKVTPAHDPNDFEMGNRHNLPFINIMNKDGTLNENAGSFQGQDRFVARKNVVERLENDGFLVKIEDYKHTVPYSDRGKVAIEPLLSTQWFVKIRPLADRALQFLDEQNSPEFVPQRWTKVYRDWLVKLKDWCISRQLWWGHQIPAWYAISETHGEITDSTPFVVARTEVEAKEKAVSQFGQNVKLVQDPDVLDTWFSSGLWPFSTLGWPEKTREVEFYYPTSTLVTGFDIIFFWVARMTMMAGYFTDQMPFKDVYIHGLVLDENGEKMSKTKGNGIDPLLMIDKYGTDALRYTLVKQVAGAGQDIRFDYIREKDESPSVETSRNFTNKLWNASRFAMMNLDGQTPQDLGNPTPTLPVDGEGVGEEFGVDKIKVPPVDGGEDEIKVPPVDGGVDKIKVPPVDGGVDKIKVPPVDGGVDEIKVPPVDGGVDEIKVPPVDGGDLGGVLELSDRWILSRYYQTVQQTCDYIDNYGLGEAAKGLYDFFWGDFCDWYIELVKSRLQKDADANSKKVAQQTIAFVLEGILKLLHPFMPHITEEIWHTLTQSGEDKSLALQAFPKADVTLINPDLEQDFALLINTIRTLRNLRAEVDIKPGAKVTAILQSESEKERQILRSGESYIQTLAKVENLTITPSLDGEIGQNIAGVVGTVQALIPLAGIIDVVALSAKLQKKLTKVEGEIKSVSGRLSNPNFVDKAAPEVVQGAKDALAEAEKQTEILRERLKQLG